MNPHTLHQALGDFWYSYFGGAEQVGTYIEALVQMHEQTSQTVKELLESLSRHEISPFHTRLHYPLKVSYTEFLTASNGQSFYDGTYSYNGEIQYSASVGQNPILFPRVPIPDNVVSIGSVTNRLTNPTISIDNPNLDGNYLSLPWNPFTLDFTIEIQPDGEKYVTLWLHNVKLDCNDLYTQFGYALDILPERDSKTTEKSALRYKEILNAYTDCLLSGGSEGSIFQFIKAVAGTGGKVVTEDSDIAGLNLPQGFSLPCLKGNLIFQNKSLPCSVSSQNGYTRFDLPVLGTGAETFNDIAFQRGIDACVEVTDPCELEQVKRLLKHG